MSTTYHEFLNANPVRFMTRDEERIAAERGDKHALIESQLPWALRLTQQFASRMECCEHIDELASAANAALLECVDRFDPKKARLTTFVAQAVRWGLLSELQLIRRGLSASDRVKERRGISSTTTVAEWTNDIEPQNETEPIQAAILSESVDRVREAIGQLPDRERYVIQARFYAGKTLLTIAQELGVSKERVRQIETRAKKQLAPILEAVA